MCQFFRFVIVLSVMVVVAGCASQAKYLPKQIEQQPDIAAFSLKHPAQWEQEGVKTLLFFKGLFNEELFAEGGYVWRPLGKSGNALVKGEALLLHVPDDCGHYLVQGIFPMTEEEVRSARFFLPNRDLGWAYKMSKAKVPGGVDVKVEKDAKGVPYDPKRFDSDKEYQAKFFETHGMSLSEMDSMWNSYFSACGSKPEGFIAAYFIQVGSKEWEDYKDLINMLIEKEILHAYEMPNGELRYGYLPLKDFRAKAVHEPGFSGINRYRSKMKIGFSTIIGLATGIFVPGAGSLAGGIPYALIRDEWSGSFFRSTGQRKENAPGFVAVSDGYRQRIQEKNQFLKALFDENERLEKENQELKSRKK